MFSLNNIPSNDGLIWHLKAQSQIPFFILLSTFSASTLPAIKKALEHLICHILSQSILFHEDAQEANLWLKALPEHRPNVSLELPADLVQIDMQDEDKYIVTFLNKCVQGRHTNYVKGLRSLAAASTPCSRSFGVNHADRLEEYLSPLLMTLLEHQNIYRQLANKSRNGNYACSWKGSIGKKATQRF